MVRAAALLLGLLAAPITSERVEVRGRGAVDLLTFECRDVNRSTVVQRVCYETAQRTLLVEVKGAYQQFCNLPAETYAAFMGAPSMGLFFNRNISEPTSSEPKSIEPKSIEPKSRERYRCPA
jgi:hypothetical protein